MSKEPRTVNIHGKDYETVASRVERFRSEKDYSIETELLHNDETIVVMKAIIKNGDRIVATGHAEEKRASSQINRTSALENCETSAIGRCLACLGYIGTEFASADEVANAIHQQSPKTPTSAKPVENGETIAKREECKTELIARAGGNVDAAAKLLEEMTQFRGRDGTMVRGLQSCQYLKDARLEILYSKLFPKPKINEGYSSRRSEEEAKTGLKNPFRGDNPPF